MIDIPQNNIGAVSVGLRRRRVGAGLGKAVGLVFSALTTVRLIALRRSNPT